MHRIAFFLQFEVYGSTYGLNSSKEQQVYAYVEMILRTERSPTTLSWISARAEDRVCQGLYDGEQLDASFTALPVDRLGRRQLDALPS